MTRLSKADRASIARFKADLDSLDREGKERELERVTRIINDETDWQEALVASLKLEK